MKKSTTLIMSALVAASGFSMNAQRLWIVGDGVQAGWDLEKSTALLATTSNPDVYTGTVYLEGGKDFKLLTTTDWGGTEYGSAEGAVSENGVTQLASGTMDTGYGKLNVSESANYLLTVDLGQMKMTAEKSSYQDTQIHNCSLFMVGDATAGGWSVDEGTPLYQQTDTPYVYNSGAVALNKGAFKIATTIKGGGTFASKYFYFRDAADETKMVLDQTEDLQWQITEAGNYIVEANTLTNTISITKAQGAGGIDTMITDGDIETEYYTLQGVKVAEPTTGLYLRVRGTKAEKIMVR